MNDTTSSTPDFELTLDRLVDGQLEGTAYREFVGSLETQPNGWRRCALAFLEDQAFRRELRQEVAEPVVAPASSAPAERESRFGWLALAAAVLVAFTLGAVLRGGRIAGPANDPNLPLAAAPDSAAPTPPAAPQLAQDDTSTRQEPSRELALENQLAADLDPALTVVVGEGETEQSFCLPMSEVDELEDDWYARQQWAFDSAAQQELAAQGYQGTSRQSFVPIDLGDGRRMVLPVEEVMIQPVAYQ